ncbi:putative glycerol kinase 3-like [Tropilaelaps mercedesae]|uniref:Putative glycerol kinase 3-like n=1 Tax=Tropilaelaps mercedesae TaxID=418985 RepID=A0A1V9XX72_9ACAR|nr:putative glycerol kinase 3-like [Tropilaelaps mercedesae]
MPPAVMTNLHVLSKGSSKYGPLIGAIDQGTSSSRFLIFSSRTLELITYHQIEVRQICPHEGWMEEDPVHLLKTVIQCMSEVWSKLTDMKIDPHDVFAIGLTNQRESTIVWDKNTGKPYHNAICK